MASIAPLVPKICDKQITLPWSKETVLNGENGEV